MTYTATIDGGEGGEETFAADSAAEALELSVRWAKKGDWPEDRQQCRSELAETTPMSTPEFENFEGFGELLVQLRLARGISQRELAKRLFVKPSLVSRDEKNKYEGVTLARATRILDALEFRLRTTVVPSGESK